MQSKRWSPSGCCPRPSEDSNSSRSSLCVGYRRVPQGEYGSEEEMNIMLTADPQAKHLPGFSLGGLQLTTGKDEEAGKTA